MLLRTMENQREKHMAKQTLTGTMWVCWAYGFPKLGILLGVLVVRIVVYWGLYWDPTSFGIYHVGAWVNLQAWS